MFAVKGYAQILNYPQTELYLRVVISDLFICYRIYENIYNFNKLG